MQSDDFAVDVIQDQPYAIDNKKVTKSSFARPQQMVLTTRISTQQDENQALVTRRNLMLNT